MFFVNANLLYDRFWKEDMMSLLPRHNKKLVYASKKFSNFDIPIVDKIFDFDVNFIRWLFWFTYQTQLKQKGAHIL